jgi:hypothetical protein
MLGDHALQGAGGERPPIWWWEARSEKKAAEFPPWTLSAVTTGQQPMSPT